jgi:type III restriction enzyme
VLLTGFIACRAGLKDFNPSYVSKWVRPPITDSRNFVPAEHPFFEHPILNSPYEEPRRHWELDGDGQPTQEIISTRRRAEFISPIPKPKMRKGQGTQTSLELRSDDGISTQKQQYASAIINDLRAEVDAWRKLPSPSDWNVSPETGRLLEHWRRYEFTGMRPFFCQVEAAETAIWLTEVAPRRERWKRKYLQHLVDTNKEANPELLRLALKLATGAGKTTVMAMLIAWQTVNAVRRPGSQFSKGFLVVSPGLTIRDRLSVIKPNDPYNYYATRELVPQDMLQDVQKAVVIVENYHKFKLRERIELSKGTRGLLQGRGEKLNTLETEGQMLQRVMPELLGMKNILVINDEAHHCYRHKEGEADETDIASDEKQEAKENEEAARMWISGLEAVKRKIGISRVIDLSATPFFLRGSGYAEGSLFPWTMSDFSLMDAIECGIVKLPRVPVSDNIPTAEVPVFRDLWENIRGDMPKKSKANAGQLDPQRLPIPLKTALSALYNHYKDTFELWEQAGIESPPCFIVVCNNTSTSKLVYDYISGYDEVTPEGPVAIPGALTLFRNHDDFMRPLAKPRTILVDSAQLEGGAILDEGFRKAALPEVERFRRELRERGEQEKADSLTDADLLREVMNTVGKNGTLGASVRCVVSVSMLTEGWDVNTVTHVLGVRAFGTQLLCEQVVGRALRRLSYQIDSTGKFQPEYADILGIPFTFAKNSVPSKPQVPPAMTHVYARKDHKDQEIRFPRVQGYRVERTEGRLEATFTPQSRFELTPDIVGPTDTRVEGIVGQGINLTLQHMKESRYSTIVFQLAAHMLKTTWKGEIENPGSHVFTDLRRIAREWIDGYLVCTGGTQPAQLLDPRLLDTASDRITAAITRAMQESSTIHAILDPYNPIGSSAYINFRTTKADLWQTRYDRCQVNYVVVDSGWEAEFCRVAEAHPRVRSYVKNHAMGFEVPYRTADGSTSRIYRPDFIVRIDDGYGADDLLNLVVEIKGFRNEDAKDKRETMETYWVPGINRSGKHGRWAFAEFTSVYTIESEFAKEVEARFNQMIAGLPAAS